MRRLLFVLLLLLSATGLVVKDDQFSDNVGDGENGTIGVCGTVIGEGATGIRGIAGRDGDMWTGGGAKT